MELYKNTFHSSPLLIQSQSQSILLFKNHNQTRFNSPLRYRSNLPLMSTTCDGSGGGRGGSIHAVSKKEKFDSSTDNLQKLLKFIGDFNVKQNEAPQQLQGSLTDYLQQLSKFLDDLNLKKNKSPQEDSLTDNLQQLIKLLDDLNVEGFSDSQRNEASQENSLTDSLQRLFKFLDGLNVKVNEAPQQNSLTDILQQLINFLDGLNLKENFDSRQNEAPQEDSLTDDPSEMFEFSEDFDFDHEDKYSTLVDVFVDVFVDAVVLCLVSSVVRAINLIPVVPKVFKLVCLGYAIWLGFRYLSSNSQEK